MNFCNPLSEGRYSKPFGCLVIDAPNNLRLKRSHKGSSLKIETYVLRAVWNNSRGDKCTVSFAFSNKMKYQMLKKVLHSFVDTLNAYNEAARMENAEMASANAIYANVPTKMVIRDLAELDDADYLGRDNSDDLSSLEYDRDYDDVESEDDRPNYHNHRIDLMGKRRRSDDGSGNPRPKRWSLKRFLQRFAHRK